MFRVVLACLTLAAARAAGETPMSQADREAITAGVKAMYEEYPFPSATQPAVNASYARHLAQMPHQSWIFSGPTHLPEVTNFVFGGYRDWMKEGTRVLVAGGGTGHTTLPLAASLQEMGSPAQIIHFEMTGASIKQARDLFQAAGVTNTRFVQGSLLDLDADLLGGKFDLIDCTGVLHHTADPPLVLKKLSASLKPDGGIGMMLYGKLGRSPIYYMRDLMQKFPADSTRAEQLDRLWGLLDHAPASNWLNRMGWKSGERDELRDIVLMDAFLHPQDVAYRVDELYSLVDSADLRITSFLREAWYDPRSFVKDPKVLADILALPKQTQQEMAELYAGFIGMHEFYMVKKDNPVEIPRSIVTSSDVIIPRCSVEARRNIIRMLRGAGEEVEAGKMSIEISGNYKTFVALQYYYPQLSANIMVLVDGKRSVQDIYDELNAQYTADLGQPLDAQQYIKAVKALFSGLQSMGWWMLQRAPQ